MKRFVCQLSEHWIALDCANVCRCQSVCVCRCVWVCSVCVSICVCLGQCLPFIRNVYLAQHTSYELRSAWAASRPPFLPLSTCISFSLFLFLSYILLLLPHTPPLC